MGDDSLICEPGESNEHDKYAVAIAFDDCVLKKVVGHVPLYSSKLGFKFLQCLCCCYWQEDEQKTWSRT